MASDNGALNRTSATLGLLHSRDGSEMSDVLLSRQKDFENGGALAGAGRELHKQLGGRGRVYTARRHFEERGGVLLSLIAGSYRRQ